MRFFNSASAIIALTVSTLSNASPVPLAPRNSDIDRTQAYGPEKWAQETLWTLQDNVSQKPLKDFRLLSAEEKKEAIDRFKVAPITYRMWSLLTNRFFYTYHPWATYYAATLPKETWTVLSEYDAEDKRALWSKIIALGHLTDRQRNALKFLDQFKRTRVPPAGACVLGYDYTACKAAYEAQPLTDDELAQALKRVPASKLDSHFEAFFEQRLFEAQRAVIHEFDVQRDPDSLTRFLDVDRSKFEGFTTPVQENIYLISRYTPDQIESASDATL